MFLVSLTKEKILQRKKLTHPSNSSVLKDHVQSLWIALHSFSRDQDAVCGITSGCSSIHMFVMSSDLTADVGFNAIGSDDEITFYPGTIFELHSSLEVVVHLDDPRVDTDVASIRLSMFE